MAYHGIKVRQRLLDNYIDKYSDRMTYQRTRTRVNLSLLSKNVMSEILGCFQFRCPVETGYGSQFGIRIKRVKTLSGKASKLIYDIIIGTEQPAKGGQIRNAPYIAIQNITDNEGWIDYAISDAKWKISKMNIGVQIYDATIISKYIRKSASNPRSKGGVSGYRVRVSFIPYEAHENNKRR